MTARKASSSVFELLVGKALRAPLWLLISAVVARLLGPEGVGVWSMTLAAGMLLNQICFHWTQSITQKYGRTALLEKGNMNEVMTLRLLLLLFGLGLCVAAVFFLQDWFQKLFGVKPEAKLFLALMAFWLMAETQSLQQVQERFVLLAWSPIVADLMLLAALGAVAFDVPGLLESTLDQKLVLFLSAMSISWLVFLLLELRSLQFRFCLPDFKPLPGMILFAIPLVPGFLIAYFSEWADYFLIRHFNDEYSVGLYHPAYQFLLILIGLPTALASVLLPKFVGLFEKNPEQSLSLLLVEYAPLFTMAWGMLLLVPMALLPSVFQLLVGERFVESVPLLTILLIAAPGAIAQHVFGISYFLRGKLLVSTVTFFLLKLVLNVALTVTLIRSIGLTAAAIGAATSFVVLQWLFVWFASPDGRPAKNAVLTLLWCQACGLALAFTPGLELRLLMALALLICSIFYIRTIELLNQKILIDILPGRLQPHVDKISRWTVKTGNRKQ